MTKKIKINDGDYIDLAPSTDSLRNRDSIQIHLECKKDYRILISYLKKNGIKHCKFKQTKIVTIKISDVFYYEMI